MAETPYTPSSATITGRLADLAEQKANDPALVIVNGSRDEIVSRGEFAALSNQCASHLKGMGVAPGAAVVLFFDHQPLCYAMFFGAMAVGAIPTFMPTRTAKQEPTAFWQSHEALFKLIDPAAIFVAANDEDELSHALPKWSDCLTCYEHISKRTNAGRPEPICDEIAFLQHSSGTTGLKKGVALSHRAVLAHCEAYSAVIGLTEEDVIVSWLPVYHDMGLIACLLLPLLAGVPVVLIDRMAWLARPGSLFDAIERYQGTACWLPNFAFAHLAAFASDLQIRDLSSMRLFINCSEPCRPQSTERFVRVFGSWGVDNAKIATCYAMAEAVFAISQSKPGEQIPTFSGHEDRPDTLASGRLLNGMQIEIRDPEGTVLSAGSTGEIWIKGAWLFEGYFNRPDLTSERIQDGWYRTGDLGFLDLGGELFVLGRTDDLLVIDGRNIFAHDVEDALSCLDGLAPGRNLALGIADADAGTSKLTILAEAISPCESSALKKSIRRLLNQRFALSPGQIVLLAKGQLRKTTSGKISRQENQRAFLQGQLRSGYETHVN